MANIKGTNFKTIEICRNITHDVEMFSVVIRVGSVKMATFDCPPSCIEEIIRSNI